MADKLLAPIGVAALMALTLAACGQTGALYLPEPASEVVSRPADTSPPTQDAGAPNSPQTPDSQPAPPSPAPEVTAPEGTPPADETKKEKNAAAPPE